MSLQLAYLVRDETIRPATKSKPVAANLSHKQWRKAIWNHSPTLRSMKSA